jgi:hypothetical protein
MSTDPTPTTEPNFPQIPVTKDQVQQANTLIYCSGTTSQLNTLMENTNFTVNNLQPYFISNGNPTPQIVSFRFEIYQKLNTSSSIGIFENFLISINSGKKNILSVLAEGTINGTVDVTLNQFDILLFRISAHSSIESTDTMVIQITSLQPQTQVIPCSPCKKSKFNIWYIIIIVFFILCTILTFYFWRKHHYQTQPHIVKK